jgi:hypothetical protein
VRENRGKKHSQGHELYPMEIPCSGCVSRNTPATPKKITLFSALLNLVVSSTAGWMDLVQSSSEAYYENFQKSKL